MQFRLPLGNEVRIGSMTLKSNGLVDPQEGKVPQGGLPDILETRVEEFVRSQDASKLGQGWHSWKDPEEGTFTASKNANPMTDTDSSGQFLTVDPKAGTVTLQTQGIKQAQFNHWIEASFDPSGNVNPRSITEWTSD